MLQLLFRGIFTLLVTILLAACGGGGGGGDDSGGSSGGGSSSGGSSSGGSSGGGPTTYNPYLPAGDDIRLHYNNESSPARFEDVTIGSEEARALAYTSGGKQYFLSDESGIYFLGFYGPDLAIGDIGTFTIDLRLNEKLLLWREELEAGHEQHFSGSGTVDISPTYGKKDFTFEANRLFLGEEMMPTPFGELPAKLVLLTVEASAQIDGTTVLLQNTNAFAFIEGIGIAHQVDNRVEMELTDFAGPDSDSDGVPDIVDEFPDDPGKTFDTDGDGIANEEDPDDDNDEVLDGDDAFPMDPEEWADSDGDGIGDNADPDTVVDTDGDGVPDSQDAFPGDPEESVDTDEDGTGNNADPDDDGDGVADGEDAFPLDPEEWADSDNDGIGDNADPDAVDTDGDGVPDDQDAFPDNPEESVDTDEDGTGNNADQDDDGDGVADGEDAFPLDPNEQSDLDGDGTGDNSDPDIDGDGVINGADVFPSDPNESTDTDGDGTGDNADTDDDGDGTSDDEDAFPTDPEETSDFDGDDVGDNADTDDDNDGHPDTEDNYPHDPEKWAKLALTDATHDVIYIRGSSENSFTYTVGVEAENLDWELGSLPPGISADVSSSHGSGQIVFTLDMIQVPVDSDTKTISVTDTDAGDVEQVTFNFDIRLPEFGFAQPEQELDASFGWETQSLTNQIFLNTGSNIYPTEVAVDFPVADGWNTVTQMNVDGGGEEFVLNFVPSQFYEGEHSGTVTFSTVVDEETISANYPFVVKASAHRLIAHDNGIAFSSFPNKSVLSQSVLIEDSYWQGGVPWTATASVPWLTVTPSGFTGENMVVTADPAGLAQVIPHTAEITISSSNGAVENSETIRVGLWIGSADPQQKVTIDADYNHIVADPVAPLVYAASGNTVDAYNVYTGLKENTFSMPVTTIGSLAISSDGRRLYATDSDQNRIGYYGLESGTNAAQTYEQLPTYVRFGRVNGQPLLFSHYQPESYYGSLIVFDAEDLSLVDDLALMDSAFDGELDVSENGKVYCSTDANTDPYSPSCFDLAFSSVSSEVSSTLRFRGNVNSDGRDIAVNFDGSVAYGISGSSYSFVKFDTATGTTITEFSANAYPNCVEIGREDTFFSAAMVPYGPGETSPSNNYQDLWVYNADEFLQTSNYLSGYAAGIKERGLAASADGLMATVIAGESSSVAAQIIFYRTYQY